MRQAAQQQAQAAAHRLTSAAMAGSAARVASGRQRSTTPSNGSTRAPSVGSTASSMDVRRARSPSGSQVPDDDSEEAASVAGAAAAAGTLPITVMPGNCPADSPDALDIWVLREELRRATTSLARAVAAPEVVNSLDLPGLAALRTELVAAHTAALDRIDDRRVTLQARQASTQEGPERGRCVACWSRSADRVLLPCRHLCLCGACLRSCRSTCPICRGPVKDALEVFGVA
mmetsp:Transcript_172607/g.419856  ORF Transcript_172607/g.419856 Transcript_172607/m.419856 type:complete len:231 (-) Transcript_172607:245-937(-)